SVCGGEATPFAAGPAADAADVRPDRPDERPGWRPRRWKFLSGAVASLLDVSQRSTGEASLDRREVVPGDHLGRGAVLRVPPHRLQGLGDPAGAAVVDPDAPRELERGRTDEADERAVHWGDDTASGRGRLEEDAARQGERPPVVHLLDAVSHQVDL